MTFMAKTVSVPAGVMSRVCPAGTVIQDGTGLPASTEKKARVLQRVADATAVVGGAAIVYGIAQAVAGDAGQSISGFAVASAALTGTGAAFACMQRTVSDVVSKGRAQAHKIIAITAAGTALLAGAFAAGGLDQLLHHPTVGHAVLGAALVFMSGRAASAVATLVGEGRAARTDGVINVGGTR